MVNRLHDLLKTSTNFIINQLSGMLNALFQFNLDTIDLHVHLVAFAFRKNFECFEEICVTVDEVEECVVVSHNGFED